MFEKGSDPLKTRQVSAGEGQTPFRITRASRSWLSRTFKTALLGSIYAAASHSTVAEAQQTAWQPTRLPSQSDARPLATSPQGAKNQAAQNSGQGSGVGLRWMSVTTSPAPTSTTPASSAAMRSAFANNSMSFEAAFNAPPRQVQQSNSQNTSMRAVQPAAAQSNGSSDRAVSSASGWIGNPLRGNQGVRTANYQPQTGNDPFSDSRPALPGDNLPSLPPSNLPAFPPTQLPQDPLSNVEPPPAPGREEVQPEAVSPLSNNPQNDTQRESSPFDRAPNQKPDPFGDSGKDADQGMDENAKDGADQREDLKMPKRKNANINSCNDMRDRVRQMRLSDISLNVSPGYGEGLRAREAVEKDRLNFAATAPIRDWMDYTGTIVATGRLIDLRDDRVVLDLNGREQTIPLRDLSDVDIAYVAEAWNLPMKCGIGYEAYAGRQFIPSAIEWKASGLCHKPLYFEDVQLERYGHEVGPVLQPLLSSAHFFGNMLILPYKMGIHPPGECQYALGYYRPGNCAPYMIQPFPFSLRGAAVQAGFVSGAAVLIP